MESFAKHIKDRIGEEGGSRFTVRKQGVLSHIFATTLVELMEDHFDQLYIRMCMYWDRNLKKVDCYVNTGVVYGLLVGVDEETFAQIS